MLSSSPWFMCKRWTTINQKCLNFIQNNCLYGWGRRGYSLIWPVREYHWTRICNTFSLFRVLIRVQTRSQNIMICSSINNFQMIDIFEAMLVFPKNEISLLWETSSFVIWKYPLYGYYHRPHFSPVEAQVSTIISWVLTGVEIDSRTNTQEIYIFYTYIKFCIITTRLKFQFQFCSVYRCWWTRFIG